MRSWLIANSYAVSAVLLTALCIVGVALLIQPAACTNPARSTSTPPPEPTLQPVAGTTPQLAPTEDNALAPATPGSDSKNYAGEGQPAMPAGMPGGGLLVCSSGGDADWSTTAEAFQVVCQCTINLPAGGWAFLSAGASLSNGSCDCEYEAQFRLGIDSTEGDPASDRWINIYGDAGDGMDAVLAVSALRPLKAGPHTFYLLCRRTEGTGALLLHDPNLAVLAWAAAVR